MINWLLILVILTCLALLTHCHYRKPVILESEQELKIATEAAEVREAWKVFYDKALALKKKSNVRMDLTEVCSFGSNKYIWFFDPVKLNIRISKSKEV